MAIPWEQIKSSEAYKKNQKLRDYVNFGHLQLAKIPEWKSIGHTDEEIEQKKLEFLKTEADASQESLLSQAPERQSNASKLGLLGAKGAMEAWRFGTAGIGSKEGYAPGIGKGIESLADPLGEKTGSPVASGMALGLADFASENVSALDALTLGTTLAARKAGVVSGKGLATAFRKLMPLSEKASKVADVAKTAEVVAPVESKMVMEGSDLWKPIQKKPKLPPTMWSEQLGKEIPQQEGTIADAVKNELAMSKIPQSARAVRTAEELTPPTPLIEDVQRGESGVRKLSDEIGLSQTQKDSMAVDNYLSGKSKKELKASGKLLPQEELPTVPKKVAEIIKKKEQSVITTPPTKTKVHKVGKNVEHIVDDTHVGGEVNKLDPSVHSDVINASSDIIPVARTLDDTPASTFEKTKAVIDDSLADKTFMQRFGEGISKKVQSLKDWRSKNITVTNLADKNNALRMMAKGEIGHSGEALKALPKESLWRKTSKIWMQAKTMFSKGEYRGEEAVKKVEDVLSKNLKSVKERKIVEQLYLMKSRISDIKLKQFYDGYTDEKQIIQEMEYLKSKLDPDTYARIDHTVNEMARVNNEEAVDILVGRGWTKADADHYVKDHPFYLHKEATEEQAFKLGMDMDTHARMSGALGKNNLSAMKARANTNSTFATKTDVIDSLENQLMMKARYAEKKAFIDETAKLKGFEIGHMEDGIPAYNKNRMPEGHIAMEEIKATNGKIYAFPRDVAEVLHGMDRQHADIVTKMLGSANRLFTKSATEYSWRFSVFMNPFRDYFNSVFRSSTGMISGGKGDTIKATMGALTSTNMAYTSALKNIFGIEDEIMKEVLKRGLRTHGSFFGDVQRRVQPLMTRLKLAETTAEKAGVAARGFLETWERVSTSLDLAAKMNEMLKMSKVERAFMDDLGKIHGIEKGGKRVAGEFKRISGYILPEDMVISISKDVTVDFNQMGNAVGVIRMVQPFINPKIQDWYNLGRGLQGYNRQALLQRGAAMMSTMALAYGYNKHKHGKEMDKMSPYDTDRFMLVDVGIKTQTKSGESPVMLPLMVLPEALQPAWSVMRRAIDIKMARPDGKAWAEKKFKNNLVNTFSVANVAGQLAGPALRLPFALASNRDFFKQKDIEPLDTQVLPKELRARPETSNIYRKLGEMSKDTPFLPTVSPAKLEFAFQSTVPGFETMATVTLEGLAALMGKVNKSMELSLRNPQLVKEQSNWERVQKVVPLARVGKFNAKTDELYERMREMKEEKAEGLYLAKRAYDRMKSSNSTPEDKTEYYSLVKTLKPNEITALKQHMKKMRMKERMPAEDYAFRQTPKWMRKQLMEEMGD